MTRFGEKKKFLTRVEQVKSSMWYRPLDKLIGSFPILSVIDFLRLSLLGGHFCFYLPVQT